jgi:mannose/fructose/N-acetylgalactosamine-specific phosphotransferase system component IIC
MKQSKQINPLILLLVAVVLFLILSAVFMVMWNHVVKKAFKKGAIEKIDYGTAIGLTFFIAIFFSPVVVTQAQPLAHSFGFR